MMAMQIVQTGRAGKAGRHAYQASTLAQSLLEKEQAKSVTLLPMGAWAPTTGVFSDSVPYTAQIEVFSMGGVGPASGLDDTEIRRMKVTVTWDDSNGSHQAFAEGIMVKIAR